MFRWWKGGRHFDEAFFHNVKLSWGFDCYTPFQRISVSFYIFFMFHFLLNFVNNDFFLVLNWPQAHWWWPSSRVEILAALARGTEMEKHQAGTISDKILISVTWRQPDQWQMRNIMQIRLKIRMNRAIDFRIWELESN